MPELPEVETTKSGIAPYIQEKKILSVTVRHPRLRWPIPSDLAKQLVGNTILSVERRAKYLLCKTITGTLIIHLGMSGSLRILLKFQPPQKHDHVDIEFANKIILRYTDPRRFGAILWTTEDPKNHSLLKHLGPEPLSKDFSGKYLANCAQKKTTAIKSFIMDNKIVVGVGNIYATEALFAAKIHPLTPANTLSLEKFNQLTKFIKIILKKSIKQGGTTLKDFSQADGKPGYFVNNLLVYGRANLPCITCGTPLATKRIGQRSSVFCEVCQTGL